MKTVLVWITVAAFVFAGLAQRSFAQVSKRPAEIEKLILDRLDQVGKFGSYAESDEKELEKANKAISDLILGSRTVASLAYSFPKLKDRMYITTSADGKLRTYSWDLETGGTLHNFETIFQFRGANGTVHTWTEGGDEEDVGGGFYTQIAQIAGPKGPIYLAVSNYIASNSLQGQSVDTLTIEGETLNTRAKLIRTGKGLTNTVGFAYDFFTVVDRPERPIKLFFFDEAKKEFRFPVVIEDDKTPQGRVTDKFITYRFNGRNFVKVK